MADERVIVTPTLRSGNGVVCLPDSEDLLADVQAMVAALHRDKLYGPYTLRMSHENMQRLNPALYAELVAAGVDTPVELLLDADGRLTGWRRL